LHWFRPMTHWAIACFDCVLVVTLILFVLIQRSLRAVCFTAGADKPAIYFVSCSSNPLFWLVGCSDLRWTCRILIDFIRLSFDPHLVAIAALVLLIGQVLTLVWIEIRQGVCLWPPVLLFLYEPHRSSILQYRGREFASFLVNGPVCMSYMCDSWIFLTLIRCVYIESIDCLG